MVFFGFARPALTCFFDLLVRTIHPSQEQYIFFRDIFTKQSRLTHKKNMNAKPWIACLASSLLVSVALTSDAWTVFSVVLLLGGVCFSPLPGELGRAALAIAQQSKAGTINALGKHVLPMVLLSVLVAMAFAAGRNHEQQSVAISFPWIALASAAAGIAIGLRWSVVPEVLGAFMCIPLTVVGLWMGLMLRRPSNEKAPTHVGLGALLAMFVTLVCAWLVMRLTLQAPSSRQAIPIAAPMSPVFANTSVSSKPIETTLHNLPSMLPYDDEAA